MLTVLAASPELHAWMHSNAGDADHECAVTLYQHGLEAATVGIILMATVWVFLARATVATQAEVLRRPRYWLPPALAPPVR